MKTLNEVNFEFILQLKYVFARTALRYDPNQQLKMVPHYGFFRITNTIQIFIISTFLLLNNIVGWFTSRKNQKIYLKRKKIILIKCILLSTISSHHINSPGPIQPKEFIRGRSPKLVTKLLQNTADLTTTCVLLNWQKMPHADSIKKKKNPKNTDRIIAMAQKVSTNRRGVVRRSCCQGVESN